MEKYMQYFLDTFEDFDKDRQQREKAWNRWNAMWRGVFDQNYSSREDGVMNPSVESSTKSKLYVNQGKQAVISAVSNVMSILFQQLPPFTVAGRGSVLDDMVAKEIQEAVWYFLQQSDFPIAVRRYITQAAIYGTTYGKVYMDTIRDARIDVLPVLNPITLQPMGSQRIPSIKEWPTIKFSDVDIFSIWEDPEHTGNGLGGRGIFHRLLRSERYIKSKIQRGEYRNVPFTEKLSSSYHRDNRDRRRSIEGLPPVAGEQIELFEYWGTMPAEEASELGIEVMSEELEVPVHCVLLGRNSETKDTLLAERNGLPGQTWPFVKDIWEDLGYGSYGRGVFENIQGPQMALNATINSRIDNKASAIQQMLGVDISMLEDPENDLKFKPNWIIRTNGDPNQAIVPFSVPDITQSAYIEAKEFERMIEEQSGVTKYVQGTESFGSNRTAQGISLVFQAANKFLRDITAQFEQNVIAKTCKLTYQMMLQFMPDEFLIMVTENPLLPQYKQVQLPNLAADVDFVASGIQGLAMKEMAQSQLIEFLQVTANPMDMQYVNRPLLLRKIYEGFGFKDADMVIMAQNPLAMLPAQTPPPAQGPTNVSDQMSGQGGSFGQGATP